MKWSNRPKWAKALTAKEWAHVAESTERCTLEEVKRNAADHAARREAGQVWPDPCLDCKFIAIKLGLPV
jgi:hypothetical protein